MNVLDSAHCSVSRRSLRSNHILVSRSGRHVIANHDQIMQSAFAVGDVLCQQRWNTPHEKKLRKAVNQLLARE